MSSALADAGREGGAGDAARRTPFTRADGDDVHEDLLRLIAAGRIRPHVGRGVTMDEAGAALDDHERRRSIGRTVVHISDG